MTTISNKRIPANLVEPEAKPEVKHEIKKSKAYLKSEVVPEFNFDHLFKDKPQPKAKADKPKTKAPKKALVNKKIAVTVDGVGYESLCAALRALGMSLDKTNSPWFKINRELKKSGEYTHEGKVFKLA